MTRFCPQNEDQLNQIADMCAGMDAHFDRFKDRIKLMAAADFHEMNQLLAECGIAHSKLRAGLQLEDDIFTRKLEAAENTFQTGKDLAERQFAAEKFRLESQRDSKLRQVADRLDADFMQMSQSVGQVAAKYRNFNVPAVTVLSPTQFRNSSFAPPSQTYAFSDALARVNNLILEGDRTGLILTKTGIWIVVGSLTLGLLLFGSRLGFGGGIFWGMVIAAIPFGTLAYLSSRARVLLETLNGTVVAHLSSCVQRHDQEAGAAQKALTSALLSPKNQYDSQIVQLERERVAARSRIQRDRDQTLREFVARVGRTDLALLSRMKRSEKLVAEWIGSHVQVAAGIDQKRGTTGNPTVKFPDPAPQLIRLGELSIASVNRVAS